MAMRPTSSRPNFLIRRFALLFLGCATLVVVAAPARARGDVLASCGFEPAGDTWSFSAGGGVLNSDSGAGDAPSGQRVYSGAGSWRVDGKTTSMLIFSEVFLSGWRDVIATFRVSSTAASDGGGHTPSESVAAYLATSQYGDFGAASFGDTPDITLIGYGSGVTWGYDSGASQQTTDAGTSILRQPGGSGLRTTDGYTDFAVRVPDGARSAALKLFAKNDGAGRAWNLDDVELHGIRTESHDRLWDGDGIGTVGGGSGVWNNSASRWASAGDGNAAVGWNSANADNAYFTQAGGTVAIAAGQTVAARSLTFAADGYVVAAEGDDAASLLVLSAGGSGGPGPTTIDVVRAGDTATLNVTIACNPGVGLTKTGPGTLVLAGAGSTFSGSITIEQGTLRVASSAAILDCPAIDVVSNASFDVSAISGGYRLGASTVQTLRGEGTILGNLTIDALGVHRVGSSPGVQRVDGDYAMDGTLDVGVDCSLLGTTVMAYDQIVIESGSDGAAHNVLLIGTLRLSWSGSSLTSADQRLWILRNDTDGLLAGTFRDWGNGGLLGNYDGRDWHIYYGADAESGNLSGGNDVLLLGTVVPEPSSLLLTLSAILLALAFRTATRWAACLSRDRGIRFARAVCQDASGSVSILV